MGTLKQFILWKIILLYLTADVKGECCPVRVISNMGDLDDVYKLKVEVDGKPESICVDGCIYTRANESHVGEEYCFKNEQSEGFLQCQDTSSNNPEDAEATKNALEEENRQLETEVAAAEQEEAEAEDLGNKLEDVDKTVEDLTSSTRHRSNRDVPQTCDELADHINNLATAETVAEKLVIVVEILQTPIKKCTDSSKLVQVKVKIKTVKSENSEKLVKIKIKIKEKKDKIKKNKIQITIAAAIIDVIKNPPSTLPPKPTTPGGQIGLETTEAIGPNPTLAPSEGSTDPITMGPTEGAGPVQETSTPLPGGEEPVTMTPGGEEPVTMTPGGEEPATITPGGEEPVSITPGGEEPVPITPGGEEPVPITPGGEEPTPITPGGEEPVPITMGEEPVPITMGEEPVEMTTVSGGEEPVEMTTITGGEEPVEMM